MSVLSVFNQTVTELLPANKSVPTGADRPGDFGRELKQADARMDRPKRSEDAPVSTSTKDKPSKSDEAAAAHKPEETDNARPVKEEPKTDGSVVVDETTGGTKEQTPVEPSAQSSTDRVPEATAEAVAAVVSDSQFLEQVLTQAVGEQTAQTAQTGRGVTQQIATVITQATGQTAEAVNNAAAASAQTTGEQTTQVPVAAQARPPRTEQTQQSASTNQAQPSASTQRIAIVAEARQESGRQASADDSGQRQQNTLNGDGKLHAPSSAQAPTTASPFTAAPTEVAATNAQIFAAADTTSPTPVAATQPGQTAQTRDADNAELNTARITRGLQNAVHQKGGAVTLRLTPPEMGTVRIQLQIQNGAVNAQFHAETESTRTMLHQQMSQLRTALEQQGLSVERLGVQTMQSSAGSSTHNQSQGDGDNQANDGRSRGGFTQGQGGRQGQRPDAQQQQAFEQELTNAA